MRKLAVINFKGGTGKTTTAVNLGAGLALLGKKVLLIDMDSQGHLAAWFGLRPQRTLYHILSQRTDPQDCVLKVRDNLDLIPSDETLVKTRQDLVSRPIRERVLERTLKGMVGGYDYVFLDCAPSCDILTHNALVLADEVLLPVSCDYLSLVGLVQLQEQIEIIDEALEKKTVISCVIPTFYDKRNKKSDDVLEILKRHFGELVTEPIRINAALSHASANHETILEYDYRSRGAEDYQKLVQLVIKQEKEERHGK
jgi:chromosome partitioning protein